MAATGDGHAWILAAVDSYELPLVRYARRLLGDVDLAADAVQHAFVQLCGQSQATAGENPAPWLFRVCRNRAIDHLRRAGRERLLLDDDGGDAAPPPAAPPATDPAVTVANRDLAARLRVLLGDLPAAQRETIDLWCAGLTYRQIAEVTGRTEGHVRVLSHRGLTALRSHPAVHALLVEQTTT